MYSFNYNKPIAPDQISNFKLFNENLDSIDLRDYSGIVLADDYFCKGCYSDYGTGQGVLVIKSYSYKSKALLKADHAYTTRNWAISGDLGFVNRETYERLKVLIDTNTLYPLGQYNDMQSANTK